MTLKEIDRIPLKLCWHMALADEHTLTYKADGDYPFDLRVCRHSPVDGKPYTHYMLNGKVYKTKEALYRAMENL